jgi:hypothetical protein
MLRRSRHEFEGGRQPADTELDEWDPVNVKTRQGQRHGKLVLKWATQGICPKYSVGYI